MEPPPGWRRIRPKPGRAEPGDSRSASDRHITGVRALIEAGPGAVRGAIVGSIAQVGIRRVCDLIGRPGISAPAIRRIYGPVGIAVCEEGGRVVGNVVRTRLDEDAEVRALVV